MKNNRKNGICYICGINKATTKDHVPPKCIFPESLKPKNIKKITVWACVGCNNKMGKIDETVRDYLSLCIFTRHGEEIWEKARRKLIKNPKQRQSMIERMIDLSQTKIPNKYIKENTTKAIRLPKEFNDFIYRIFKGFHTNYTDVIVDGSFSIHVYEYPPELLEENLKSVNCSYIVNDVLILLGAISPDKKMSMWWFQLYNNPMYVCVIAPKSIFRRKC